METGDWGLGTGETVGWWDSETAVSLPLACRTVFPDAGKEHVMQGAVKK